MALEEEIRAWKEAEKDLQTKERRLTDKATSKILGELLRINRNKKVKLEKLAVELRHGDLEMHIYVPRFKLGDNKLGYVKQAYAKDFQRMLKRYHLTRITCSLLVGTNYEEHVLIKAQTF